MEANQIEILSCKFGKKLSMGYYNRVDTLNYDVEDGDETPHPDLKKALVALHPDLAASHYVLGEERENFQPTGFSITKAGDEDKIDQVNIDGKLVNSYGDKITIKSGNIPINSKGLEEKIDTLRTEYWAFFFNEKTATTQGNLPGFQSEKEAVKENASGPEEDTPAVADLSDLEPGE